MIKLLSVGYDKIGRFYLFSDNSKYYSVTTMLSATGDKTGIDNWRRKLGPRKADIAQKKASRLGNDFHLLGEHWLLGKSLPSVTTTPTKVFQNTLPILQENIDDVIAVEQPLKTDKYKLAGRVDAVVIWNGKLAILDFKLLNNSSRTWLDDYWLQTTIYARAWYEMFDEQPLRCILVIGNKKTHEAIYYQGKPKLWINRVNKRVEQFHELQRKGL